MLPVLVAWMRSAPRLMVLAVKLDWVIPTAPALMLEPVKETVSAPKLMVVAFIAVWVIPLAAVRLRAPPADKLIVSEPLAIVLVADKLL